MRAYISRHRDDDGVVRRYGWFVMAVDAGGIPFEVATSGEDFDTEAIARGDLARRLLELADLIDEHDVRLPDCIDHADFNPTP